MKFSRVDEESYVTLANAAEINFAIYKFVTDKNLDKNSWGLFKKICLKDISILTFFMNCEVFRNRQSVIQEKCELIKMVKLQINHQRVSWWFQISRDANIQWIWNFHLYGLHQFKKNYFSLLKKCYNVT